ncbi:MAG: methyltransferase domain-containing protein [Planctomycetota bacterium]
MADLDRARPKVWLLADRRGWAYDQLCHGVAAALDEHYECRIAYVQEQPDLSQWDFDLVMVCFWGETWHQQFVQDPRRVLKLISSHRWQEHSYGLLTPERFADEHLADAATLGATSRRLVALLEHERRVLHTPQGVELEHFHPAPARPDAPADDPLVFGWAGNADDPCKGLDDVLRPAADGFDVRVAGGELDRDAMAAFYREVDVLLVASTREGEPRPLLEAMASGCYAISTDVGIAPELIERAEHGQIVARRADAFRAAMHRCCADPAHVRACGRANRERLAASRSWHAVAPAWRALFDHAAGLLRAETSVAIPQPTTDADVVAQCKQAYHEHFDALNEPDENTVTAAFAYYRSELLPVLPHDRSARALDVGCGYGLLLQFLREHGYSDLHGVEIDAQLHAHASRRLGSDADLALGDAIEHLRARVGGYDLITAWDLLEHFPLGEALDFAKAVRGALRPGGVAVFRTPNMANVLGIYSRCMDLTHQVGFTEQSAGQLLRLAGFEHHELLVPDFSAEPSLAQNVAESRRFHQQLFALQDRSTPRCFDKNLVIAAHTTAPAPAGATR